jgi:phospholipid transport system transporter-binding protein
MFKFEQHKNQIKLFGQLDFDTVANLLNKPEIDFGIAENEQIEVDLSQITRFNSASLALLIEWMKMADQKGLQIKYHSAPEQLIKIAEAYGFKQKLPLSSI